MDPVSCHFCRTSSHAVCWVQVNLDISDRTYKHIASLVTYFSTQNICCSYYSTQLFNINSRILSFLTTRTNVRWLTATNCAFRKFVLLECDAASLGDQFSTFWDNIMVLSSSAKMSKCHSSWTFRPLQDETTAMLQNTRYQLHSLKPCILEQTPQLYCHKHLKIVNCALTTKMPVAAAASVHNQLPTSLWLVQNIQKLLAEHLHSTVTILGIHNIIVQVQNI
jgi:hypothetical protein